MVALLIEAGADVNATNGDGDTPLDWAKDNLESEIEWGENERVIKIRAAIAAIRRAQSGSPRRSQSRPRRSPSNPRRRIGE